jgi:L-aminopeptidase/D-esterase-like protein
MLTDVGGIRVGHCTDSDALTGCTVVICDEPMLGGVEIRGSNTATRDTPRLRPVSATHQVHGILLTGGSGFGLDATAGLARYLEQHGIGMQVEDNCLPVVTGAVLYDLELGNPKVRPGPQMGFDACVNATSGAFERGNVGAGTGATAGKFFGVERGTKGGLGTYSQMLPGGVVVSAMVAVNAFGDIVDRDGSILAGVRNEQNTGYVGAMELIRQGFQPTYWTGGEPRNTTLGVVATNAQVTAEEITKIAEMAHAGFARAINPVSALFDGDIIFAIGRMGSDVRCDVSVLGAVAADTVQLAIIDAVMSARTVAGCRRPCVRT